MNASVNQLQIAGIGIQGLETEVSTLKNFQLQLQQNINEKNCEIGDLRQCLSEKVRLISTYKTEYHKLNEENNIINNKYEELFEQHSKLKEAFDCLEVEYRNDKLSWSAKDSKISDSIGEVTALQTEIFQCRQLIAEKATNLFEKQARIDEIEKIIKSKDIQIELQDAENKKIEDDLEKTKEKFEQQIIELENSIKLLLDNKALLTSQIELQANEIRSLTDEKENLLQIKDSLKMTEGDLQKKKSLIESLNENKTVLITKIQCLEELIKRNNEASESNFKKIKDQLAAVEKEKFKYANEYSNAIKMVSNLKTENENLREEKKRLETKNMFADQGDESDASFCSRTEAGWSASESSITLQNMPYFSERNHLQSKKGEKQTSDSSELLITNQNQSHRCTKRVVTSTTLCSLSSQVEPYKQHIRGFFRRQDASATKKGTPRE